ncbi:MAG TPA: class I adenylate-forming enzyme family protein [Geminicoccaceae bacterium]|jgi:acyl-CoA synthetase (AMP-forming)/AMP-acid ligase II|nr:class I adenylate-forming enzyme family protein [Geminicoccaceae bacterium]
MPWPEEPLPPIREELHFGDRRVRCFINRPAGVPAMLASALERNPDGEALVAGDLRLSYRQLAGQVGRTAAALAALGVGPGDRVALLLGNRPEFLIVLLATLDLGAIVVPISIREQTPGITYMLAQSAARVMVHEAELADRLPEPARLPALEHRLAVGGASALSRRLEDLIDGVRRTPRHDGAEEDTAVILYTSGTTGRPKGAMLTHINIVHSVLHYALAMDLGPRDRSLLAVPASHVSGLVAVLLAMIHAAGCSIMLPAFKARGFLEQAARERITHAVLVPAMYNLCLLEPELAGFDLGAWRIGGFGGAPMPEATIASLAGLLPHLRLMNLYGATETTSPAAMMPAHHTAGRTDAVGLAVPCGELKIMDAAGRELPEGAAGEVWIGGPMVVPGYWREPELTAAAFERGFWRSGDIGALDRDGYLRIFDRLKDMINRGGYKVYSAEVENRLCQHPGVLEAAVVARPDPVLGEKVQAFVAGRTPDLSGHDLRAFCAQALADYKVPDVITISTEPLPRNANGKLIKSALRERAARETAG